MSTNIVFHFWDKQEDICTPVGSSLNVTECARTARTTPPTVMKSTSSLMNVNCLFSTKKNVSATNNGPVDLISWRNGHERDSDSKDINYNDRKVCLAHFLEAGKDVECRVGVI